MMKTLRFIWLLQILREPKASENSSQKRHQGAASDQEPNEEKSRACPDDHQYISHKKAVISAHEA